MDKRERVVITINLWWVPVFLATMVILMVIFR